MKYRLLIIGLLLAISTQGQDLHDKVTEVFNFYPHKLSAAEQKALHPKLDAFFELVIKDKETYLEPLREELRRNDNNPYFYYDGSILLMQIGQGKGDLQLAADALVKSDLRDLPGKAYLDFLLMLAKNGADVTPAALHVLDDTTFQAFIPQHVLTLNYGEGLKFILPKYDAEKYIDQLIEKYNAIPSVTHKLTCLDLFVYANNCKADRFLATLATDKSQPVEIAQKISETLKLTKVPRKNNQEKYMKLFEERNKVLSRISDEAIYELNEVTLKMRKTFECK